MANKQKKQKKQSSGTEGGKTQQTKTSARGKAQKKQKTSVEFPFGRENFILMAIGFAIIIIGYILMYGDENIYSFRKITLSVIVVMFGYLFEIYAILKTPKSRKKPEASEEQQS